jgi:hypothetical protein
MPSKELLGTNLHCGSIADRVGQEESIDKAVVKLSAVGLSNGCDLRNYGLSENVGSPAVKPNAKESLHFLRESPGWFGNASDRIQKIR